MVSFNFVCTDKTFTGGSEIEIENSLPTSMRPANDIETMCIVGSSNAIGTLKIKTTGSITVKASSTVYSARGEVMYLV